MNVVIIGAGLAGSVASGAFAADDPINYDQRTGVGTDHKAIMRLRDVNVAKYLGVHVEPVTVWKQVAWNGELYATADIRMNNLYSIKLYDEYGIRSLKSLGNVERWLIESTFRPRRTRYWHKLVKIRKGELTFLNSVGGSSSATLVTVPYDICISTIPMPVALKAAGIEFNQNFIADPIYVWTAELGYNSTLHQTIYFPDLNTPVYRATIQGRKVIIESMTDTPFDFDKVLGYFGMEGSDLWTEPEMSKQHMGKMTTINEDERRQYIYELTDKFKVYSFGRYAIWKPIRADHLVQDIEKIKRLARLTGGSASYGHNKERIG